jgi:hypothetical protein
MFMVRTGLESWSYFEKNLSPTLHPELLSRHKFVEFRTTHLPLSNARDSYLLWFSGNRAYPWYGHANIVL